jgi:O-acetyl-ADP-ribose deacetylase (regulator of RNase III)
MQLILVGRSPELSEAFREQFRSQPEVQIVCGRFEELPIFDCVITAGNSFGLMDAGMDLAVVRFFGRHVMERIQKQILDDYLGEQPVGTCVIVETDQAVHPFVAHAPTMRIPMNISGTNHAYLAMWAALTSIHRYNRSSTQKIKSVACPGLGTGTGGMDSAEAALQMFLAYEHSQRTPAFINPTMARQRHEKIYYGGRRGFLNPRKSGD